MEPVDPNEAPDYYKVIKEPMGKSALISGGHACNECAILDLQKVEMKISE